jgi:hypothetical protein
MRTKSLLAIIIVCFVFLSQAAAPPRGADRLRELVVFPVMHLNFNFEFTCRGKWLQAAGFPPGQRLIVKIVSPGVIEMRVCGKPAPTEA